MTTANDVQHEALVTLMQSLPKIRQLSFSKVDVPWTIQERLYVQGVLCHLDAYLTMLSQPTKD